MPIEALPPTTVRAIGSTSIISDPCSLVKELLDNALDASASSITIEISKDTVDLIQVKDNGHGIPATDHALVCKRAFTSKIHTVEDLRNVGRKSLGFRGEALASAAEVSGSLTISTRSDAEPVGSSLKYARNGELISTERVSHLVGTTVRISDLFRQIPVRRQTAIKTSKKTLVKIRKMVQTYAMARPSTRLSLKVLKAKSDAGNLMYAPDRHATLMEAALKIAGTDVASNCMVKEWPTPSSDGRDLLDENVSTFRLTALLPKPGSDYTKFNNAGQYISIDGRPVSSARGFAQTIVKMYKSYIRSVACRDGLSPTITEPFLCIHVTCPEGSYDVNIEPSKDDILFEDQSAVLSLAKEIFRDAYGGLSDEGGARPVPAIQTTTPRNGFEVLWTPNPHESTTPNLSTMSHNGGFSNTQSFARPGPPSHRRPTIKHTGSSGFTQSNNVRSPSTSTLNDFQGQLQSSPNLTRGRVSLRGNKNPAAVFTTPARARQTSFDSCLLSLATSLGSHPSHTGPISPPFSRTSPSTRSPESSQLSPTTPVRSVRQEQRDQDRKRYGNGSLDTWFLRLSENGQTPAVTTDSQEQDNEPSLSQLAQDRFGPEATSSDSTSGLDLSVSQTIDATPSPSSILESTQPSQNPLPPTARPGKKHGHPVLEQWSARLYNASNPAENAELQKALEFETRKKVAMEERRIQLKISTASGPTNQSRYLAARAALNTNPDSDMLLRANSNGSSKPILSPHDPRAYLMRLHSNVQTDTQGGSKIKRITSSKLPFEKILNEHDLHRVSLTLPADLALVRTNYKDISKNDLYVRSGDETDAFTLPNVDADIQMWSARLSHLIKMRYRTTEGDRIPDLEFDFSSKTHPSGNSIHKAAT
ncbi:hypothetical protein BJX70DRAFT_400208 [Aspergillus crustosus]